MAIVSLMGASYPTWKVKCKMSLMKDGMWGIVDGESLMEAKEPPAQVIVRILSLLLEGTVR